MKQLRVAWQAGIHALREPGLDATDGGPWLEESPEAREDANVLVAAGNEVCGSGSHWLEEREIREAAEGRERAEPLTSMALPETSLLPLTRPNVE